jgi:hypothetical protein
MCKQIIGEMLFSNSYNKSDDANSARCKLGFQFLKTNNLQMLSSSPYYLQWLFYILLFAYHLSIFPH